MPSNIGTGMVGLHQYFIGAGLPANAQTEMERLLNNSGSAANRPTSPAPLVGELYFNTDTGALEVYNGASWQDAAGSTGIEPVTFDGLVTANDGLTMGAGSDLTFDTGTATAVAGAATLNKQAGTVTSEALVTAAGSDYTLTLTNSVIAATSKVFVSVANGTNTTVDMYVSEVTPGAGSCTVVVKNDSGSALNGTIKISFFVVP